MDDKALHRSSVNFDKLVRKVSLASSTTLVNRNTKLKKGLSFHFKKNHPLKTSTNKRFSVRDSNVAVLLSDILLVQGDFPEIGATKLSWTSLSLPIKAIKFVALGSSHILILSKEGELFSLGNSDYGQCGNQKTEAVTTALKIHSNEAILCVAASNHTSIFLTEEKRVFTFGKK